MKTKPQHRAVKNESLCVSVARLPCLSRGPSRPLLREPQVCSRLPVEPNYNHVLHARRKRMRSAHRTPTVLGAALAVALAVTDIRTQGQASQEASNDYPNPYKIESFGQLPGARKIGATYGIDIDRDGKSVWVFERCCAATIDGSSVAPLLKFDSSGKLIASFGAGMFVFPHGIYVDRDDNIWVTDGQGNGTKGQQVFKFSPTGRVLLTLGTAGVA